LGVQEGDGDNNSFSLGTGQRTQSLNGKKKKLLQMQQIKILFTERHSIAHLLREAPGSNLKMEVGYPEIFVVFLSQFSQIFLYYTKIGHDGILLSSSFHIIIQFDAIDEASLSNQNQPICRYFTFDKWIVLR
jgi:hypothetical protein